MVFIKLNFNIDVNQCLRGLKATLRLGRPKSGIKKLEKEMTRLGSKRDDINNQIREAELEGRIQTNKVKQWLLEVGTLEGQFAAIDKDFKSMSCFSCYYCCSINRRVAEKLDEANELMTQAGGLDPIATDLRRLESGIQKLEKEMPRLRAKRDDIKNKIKEAEREGKIPTNEVRQWLREVETLEGQVADINQNFQSISCFSCNNCFNQTGGMSSQTQQAGDQVPIRESSNCCSINRIAAEKLGEVNELISRTDALDLIATDLSRSDCHKLKKEMTRLRAKRDDIVNQIGEVELEGKIPTNEVTQWLREVKILEGKVFDQDFNRSGGTSSNRTEAFAANLGDEENAAPQTQQAGDDVLIRESSNCCSIILRVVEMLGEANELMSRAGQLDPIATVGPPEPTVMLSISHRPPVGIESYVEEIVGYVDGGEGNIIGIYGMGGVGKTTILNRIQQHYLVKQRIFDRVIWVVASKDCQLKRLQMNIATSLGLQTLRDNDDQQTCGDKLFSYLKNKNCLLLLDDIWERLDLQLLGMAHSAAERGQQQQPRKVVVFTTRSETVCAQMKAEKKIKVKCLDPDQAWQLFEQNSEEDVLSSDAGIKIVAEELAKECAGLPLALVTVARAMSGKMSWEAWKEALRQIRDGHEWTTLGLLEDSRIMYKAFKLSYDSLENDSIRECLLCCALWPEDYRISKFSELIPCWIGCGIIREFNVINEAFAKGCSHLEALMAASLLEKCSNMDFPYRNPDVKMHDVIRDMALLMVSGLEGESRKWIVKAGIGLSDLPRQEEWKEAERASFMSNQITYLQEYEASTFPKLSMLILNSNDRLKITPSLFASMPHLTYLDLSLCLGITELPMEIGSLTELQYLDLSFNPIRSLPLQFGCLGKLEYLLLMGTNLEIEPGTISNLSMLKWLDITSNFHIRQCWWDELQCFKGHHQLSVAINTEATTDYIERLNMLPNVSIWKLILTGSSISKLTNYDLGIPQWGCRVSDKLECLTITHFKLDRLVLPASVGRESSLGCLKILKFSFLNLLKEISLNRVRLYNLREVSIYHCPMLKDVSWVLQLPCLYFLQIQYCREMKELISEVGNSNSISSSSIQSLILIGMPNLNRIANRPLHFPYLEYMHVYGCPRLKKLPFGAEILKNRLKEIQGGDYWWNNLDWDDESIKDSLTPYFRNFSFKWGRYYQILDF